MRRERADRSHATLRWPRQPTFTEMAGEPSSSRHATIARTSSSAPPDPPSGRSDQHRRAPAVADTGMLGRPSPCPGRRTVRTATLGRWASAGRGAATGATWGDEPESVSSEPHSGRTAGLDQAGPHTVWRGRAPRPRPKAAASGPGGPARSGRSTQSLISQNPLGPSETVRFVRLPGSLRRPDLADKWVPGPTVAEEDRRRLGGVTRCTADAMRGVALCLWKGVPSATPSQLRRGAGDQGPWTRTRGRGDQSCFGDQPTGNRPPRPVWPACR
jgi:hypothetical protein